MALEILGAGFGRTGTLSLRTALVQLGYPCYHMLDVLFDRKRKDDVDFWLEVSHDPAKTDRDWSRVFEGLKATVDYPACGAWRALAETYPDAKLILTEHPRGPEAWYQSNIATIYTGTGHDARSDFGKKINEMMDRLIWNGLLDGAMEDRDAAIKRYRDHIEEVKDTIPADRLLVFRVDQGWDPLCSFLNLTAPNTPFPNVNEREQMAKITARLKRMRSFT